MSNSRKYFGTDGVRGKVGEFPITPEFMLKLGWAAGRVLAKQGSKTVLIGKDTRISNYMLESALEAGLAAAGLKAAFTGPMPTPAIAYLTRTFRSEAGIVISASHNPYYDNGIKFFSSTGSKLDDALELEIEAELEKPLICVENERLGKAVRIEDAPGRYIEYCKGTFPAELSLSGLRIVIDCAHGAAYHIAPAVFSELGAEVIAIGCNPTGININENCGATHMETVRDAVLLHNADLGIAFDGDGDRVQMVTRHGDIIDGDQLVYVIAREALRAGRLKGGVVGTQMSNMGMEVALRNLGVPFARSKVGDRYVLELLKQKGWHIGGESSGHIIHLSFGTTGDGIVAALQVLRAMCYSQLDLAELCAGMEMFPQTLINVRFKPTQGEQQDPLQHAEVKAAVAAVEAALGDNGRVLLRKSGTEPLIRVMVEGRDGAQVVTAAQQIADAVTLATGG